MELVDCKEEYWDFVRNLRNDSRVIHGFISSDYITKEMQKSYMNNYSNCYYIALVDGKPAGFVGVINDDIRVCTHPDYQGKGVGRFMINRCIEKKPSAFAKVKLDNEASIKLFESCGFTKKFYILTKD